MHKSITVNTKMNDYEIIIKENVLDELSKYIDTSTHVFIVSDTHVAPLYLKRIIKQFKNFTYHVIKAGEQSKNMDELNEILTHMYEVKLQRTDTLITLGGGVVGDLGGLAASLYMRGIDWINIPTSTLAQIDSSIGGKVAIDYLNTKNLVGAFYQPTYVLIDPLLLNTLNDQHFMAGIVEAIKIGLTSNTELYQLIRDFDIKRNIKEIIYLALMSKKLIVEADERDLGIRNILNLGHTLGHALELKYDLIHGEAIFIGLLHSEISNEIKSELLTINQKLKINVNYPITDDLFDLVAYDKKVSNDMINLVCVETVGKGYLKKFSLNHLREVVNE